MHTSAVLTDIFRVNLH